MDHAPWTIRNLHVNPGRNTTMKQLLAILLFATCALAQAPAPTADANKRGLTDKDFPHQIKLADNRMQQMRTTEIQIVNIGRTHTGGDLAVYLPKEKVLWMSESFNPNRFPTLRTGYPTEWVKAIDTAQKMDVQYYAVAHGFID